MKHYIILTCILLTTAYSCKCQSLVMELAGPARYHQRHYTHLIARNQIVSKASAGHAASKYVKLRPDFEAQTASALGAKIEVAPVIESTPESYFSVQPYPNPAVDNIIHLEYNLPYSGRVSYRLVNSQGRLVNKYRSLEYKEAGKHSQNLSAADLARGIYIYQLQLENEQRSFRVVKKAGSSILDENSLRSQH